MRNILIDRFIKSIYNVFGKYEKDARTSGLADVN